MRLNEKIIKIKCELQNTNLKKSGYNKHQKFYYFELADFLPTLNVLMNKYQVNDRISIMHDYMILTLISGDETQNYSIPFKIFETPMNNYDKKMMQDIQYLGALNTYYKRYIYGNTFNITDGEVIDGMDSTELAPVKQFVAEELPNTIKTDLAMIKDKLNIQLEMKGIDKREFATKYGLSKDSSYEVFKKAYESIK